MNKIRAFISYALAFFLLFVTISCGERKINIDGMSDSKAGSNDVADFDNTNTSDTSYPWSDSDNNEAANNDSEPHGDMTATADESAPYYDSDTNTDNNYDDTVASPDYDYVGSDSNTYADADSAPSSDEDVPASSDEDSINIPSCDCTDEPLFEPVCCNGVNVFNNCYANCFYKNNQICTENIAEKSCNETAPANPSCSCAPGDTNQYQCQTNGEVVVSECLAKCMCGDGNYVGI